MTERGFSPSFESDIRTLFREHDREEMEWAFDLWDHNDVVAHADIILARLETGTMPCDSPWPSESIKLFREWIQAGKLE